ncbi:hypothetical protein KIN20_007264 [Parelaphostrongylus tenuis]|uniref:Uncharacterized protein n=1 Tax=Parelaphostrongylus tenuis TaxID=148309 RepID=A0AAD5QLW3_PARTN|nr:hypothetical protein KIN20_007264 [Parelaphostrongylus tenuis]
MIVALNATDDEDFTVVSSEKSELKVGLLSASTSEAIDLQPTNMCKKYRFTRKDKGVYEKNSRKNDKDDCSSSEEHEGSEEEKETKDKGGNDYKKYERRKRQIPSVNASLSPIIGFG